MTVMAMYLGGPMPRYEGSQLLGWLVVSPWLGANGCSPDARGEVGVYVAAAATGSATGRHGSEQTASRQADAMPVPSSAQPGGASGAGAAPGAADKPGSASQGAVGTTGPVTYHKEIRPIIARACLDCHAKGPGGMRAPFALGSFAEIKLVAAEVVATVVGGTMPPAPNSGCRDLAELEALSPGSRQQFEEWEQAGFPEGDPTDYVAPTAVLAAMPTLILPMPQAYLPSAADEVICFGLDHVFAEDTYLTALQLLPGTPAEVLEIQVVRVGDVNLDPRSCATALSGEQVLLNWRGSRDRDQYPKQSAAVLASGTALMLRIHYNASNGAVLPDQTRVALWTLAAGSAPAFVITHASVFGAVSLPAGDDSVTVSQTAMLGGDGFEIVGITPRARMLATNMSAALIHQNGSQECLLSIPWDYNFQQDYLFRDPLPYASGDSLRVSCTYDNSSANQPVINGTLLQPRQVNFGEGQLDEMCVHDIWLRRPFP
jgi:hypothetical protein